MSAPPAPPASRTAPAPEDGARRFRRTLVRVLAVQVVTLLLLWLLQAGFSS